MTYKFRVIILEIIPPIHFEIHDLSGLPPKEDREEVKKKKESEMDNEVKKTKDEKKERERGQFSEDCETVIIPTTTGQIGILHGHCDMITGIECGIIRIKVEGVWQSIVVYDGAVVIETVDKQTAITIYTPIHVNPATL